MLRRDGTSGETSGAAEGALTLAVALRAAGEQTFWLLLAFAVLLAVLLGVFDAPRRRRRRKRK